MSTKYLDYGVSSPRAMIGQNKVPIRLNCGHPTGTYFERALGREAPGSENALDTDARSREVRAFGLANGSCGMGCYLKDQGGGWTECCWKPRQGHDGGRIFSILRLPRLGYKARLLLYVPGWMFVGVTAGTCIKRTNNRFLPL